MPLFMKLFARPLIGPQVTWSDPGLSLAKPVGLLEEHVHHLQFHDEKSKAKQSKASLSPQRASPSPEISWENRIILHFHRLGFIMKLQVKDVLFKETDWLCFALLCFAFFHPEIAGDGRALRGDRLACLSPQRAHPSPAISWIKNLIVSVLLSAYKSKFTLKPL